jgi:AcrR family transcriptional regulator
LPLPPIPEALDARAADPDFPALRQGKSECTVTHMSSLSTADFRRPVIASTAVRVFARGGFHGTTVADVAREAGISPAYVFKLFPSKERLFVAALEDCFAQILATLETGADSSPDPGPDAVLEAMGDAYAHLIGDRALLSLQVHAQSAADIPEVRQALRAGLGSVTAFAKSRSGASDEAVQRFIAIGQLCHLIVMTGIEEAPESWAKLLTAGISHP